MIRSLSRHSSFARWITVFLCFLMLFVSATHIQADASSSSTQHFDRSNPDTVLTGFFDSYLRNIYLNEYNDIAAFFDPSHPAASVNQAYLEGKADYWRAVRAYLNITRYGYFAEYDFVPMERDDDKWIYTVNAQLSYQYADSDTPTYEVLVFTVSVSMSDTQYYISDVLEENDWFDARYKNDPDCNFDKLIADTLKTLSEQDYQAKNSDVHTSDEYEASNTRGRSFCVYILRTIPKGIPVKRQI